MPLRDDSLPHQIMFQAAPIGITKRGLQVIVTCVCLKRQRNLSRSEMALGGRCIWSNEDAWNLYRTHVRESRTDVD